MKKSFDQWMKEVDDNIRKAVGLTHLDLPDCPYHDWYDLKMRASTAAKKAVKNCFD